MSNQVEDHVFRSDNIHCFRPNQISLDGLDKTTSSLSWFRLQLICNDFVISNSKLWGVRDYVFNVLYMCGVVEKL